MILNAWKFSKYFSFSNSEPINNFENNSRKLNTRLYTLRLSLVFALQFLMVDK